MEGRGKNLDHNSSKKNELINFARCAVQYMTVEEETYRTTQENSAHRSDKDGIDFMVDCTANKD